MKKLKGFAKEHWKVIVPIAVVVIVMISIIVFQVVSDKKDNLVIDPIVVESPEPTIEPTIEPTPEPTPNAHIGEVKSSLTGKWVSKKTEQNRPFAVMINNINYAAMNQKGTASADIIYEALAEGGITRMLAIYQNPKKITSIGSVRSARHYYVSFATEWNAIYCHFGHTKYALAKIAKLGTDNISGLSGIGDSVYHRDYAYRAPHNVYVSGEKLIAGAKALKYSLKQNKKKQAKHFNFYDVDTELKSKKVKKANNVVLPFSQYSTVTMKYNKKKKIYEKFEYSQKHMDQASKKQLAFKNVIIQLVKETNIDRNGYQTMSIAKNRGKGYYCTNGKMIPIEWTKDEDTGKMNYVSLGNTLLNINPGKTYIAIYPISEQKLIKFN